MLFSCIPDAFLRVSDAFYVRLKPLRRGIYDSWGSQSGKFIWEKSIWEVYLGEHMDTEILFGT